MKKYIFILFAALAMYSCTMPQQAQPQRKPFETMVDTFVVSHPNFMNNEVTREQANEDWKKVVLDSLSNPHFLDGINVDFIRVNKTKKNGYIAQFRAGYGNNTSFYNIECIYFDVISYVPDSVVPNLVEDKEYSIKGEVIGAIDFKTLSHLYEAPTNRYTDDYKIEKTDFNDKYLLYLGNIFMNIQDLNRTSSY